MDEFRGFVVVNNTQPFGVEKWDQDLNSELQNQRIFSSVWADERLAQMVANVANALDEATLKEFIVVMEHF